MFWRILAALSLAYFAVGFGLEFAPAKVTVQVVAWRTQAKQTAACHIAALTSRPRVVLDVTSDLG